MSYRLFSSSHGFLLICFLFLWFPTFLFSVFMVSTFLFSVFMVSYFLVICFYGFLLSCFLFLWFPTFLFSVFLVSWFCVFYCFSSFCSPGFLFCWFPVLQSNNEGLNAPVLLFKYRTIYFYRIFIKIIDKINYNIENKSTCNGF